MIWSLLTWKRTTCNLHTVMSSFLFSTVFFCLLSFFLFVLLCFLFVYRFINCLVLSKVLQRHLIVPKFHCYINEPAGCYLDAVFDTYPLFSSFFVYLVLVIILLYFLTFDRYGLAELGYFENSLLRNPLVPAENLQSIKIYLPTMEETVSYLHSFFYIFIIM
jgi:hypothetical protein